MTLGDEKDLRLSGEPELEEDGLFVTYKPHRGQGPGGRFHRRLCDPRVHGSEDGQKKWATR